MNAAFVQPSWAHLAFAGMLCVLFLLLGVPAYAAQFSIEIPKDAVAPESEFVADVWLNTQGESLNALEGRLLFPDALEVAGISDGGSVVTVWLDAPMSRGPGSISFSGITPGGYNAERGFLFSVVFRAKEEGVAALSFEHMQVFLNDGNATPAPVSEISAKLVISEEAPSSLSDVSDTTPPEPFSLALAESPVAFDGKKVLIFAAQDKGFGVARYEVCEGFFASCVVADSPYVLQQQSTDSFITVHAVDHSGNVRTAYLFTVRALMRYASYGILAILLCIGALLLLARFKRSYRK